MAEYSAVPPDDPFAVSRGMFDGLTAELAGPAAAVLTACGLEELLDERGREDCGSCCRTTSTCGPGGKSSRPGRTVLP